MKRLQSLSSVGIALWWTAIGLLFALHLVHLRADFPNNSPWMDYAKYTDEGWYGNAAIRDALFGRWRLPGDFNPAAALPVWPLLLRLAFAFGGVSLVVARGLGLGILAANLAVSYELLRRSASRSVALAGVSFLVASAYLWAFSRLAILEPLLLLFMLLSWLLVGRFAQEQPAQGIVRGAPGAALRSPEATASPARLTTARLLAAGLMLCLAVLTKTTALFLVPSTLFLLWQGSDWLGWRTARETFWLAVGALVPWAAYYLLVLRAHLTGDYHYLFAANRWDQPTTAKAWFWAFWYAAHGSLWVDPMLCGLALAVLALGIWARPHLWRQPLVGASLLAAAGYIFFTGWHNNPQPRYYEVVLYPLVFVVCLGADGLWRTGSGALPGPLSARPIPGRGPSLGHMLGVAAWAVYTTTTVLNIRGSWHFARHPEYSLVRAARGVTRYIDRHPNGNRLLLSISGDQISLITHLPAICDDFGTSDLPYRVHQYQPGWYAAWNEIDPGTLEDLRTQDSLEEVARFHALDDEDRDVLILYKLHPLPIGRQHYDAEEEMAANQPRE